MENKYTVKIDHARKEIVIAKKLVKKSSVYGSDEYKYVMKLMNEHAGYSIVTRDFAPRKTGADRTTLNDMRAYIQKHDDAEGTLIAEFEAMVNEKKGDNFKRTSFFVIKKWFFAQYPDLKAKAV